MHPKIVSFSLLLSTVLFSQAVSAIGMGSFDGGGRSTSGAEDSFEVDAIDSGDYDSGTHSCEGARHEHIHENSSTNTSSREFYGIAHSFAIAFEDDFYESVDTQTNFLCSDGANTYVDCSFNKETDLGEEVYSRTGGTYHGVTVTYQTLDWISGNPKGLLWEYGTDDSSNIAYKPWLESGEQKTEGISFQLEDYNSDQTATTTSWTKMEFYYIDPDATSSERSDLDNYTHVYTNQVSPYSSDLDPDGDYIYWYGLNATVESVFPRCGETSLSCESLSITPTTSDLTMSDVFSDVNFTVTATGSDGSDITSDSEFTYSVNKFNSANDAADADGTLRYGPANFRSSKNPTTTDSTVEFEDTEPGDSLYVYVSDYEGVSYEGTDCAVEVVLPYCTTLDITDPTGLFGSRYIGTISGDEYSTNIDIDSDTSTGESWPFNVTYGSTDPLATFDGTVSPYLTTDHSITTYRSTESATVTVGLDDQNGDGESDDVAGVCNDSFFYTLIPDITIPTCEYLEFNTSSPITTEVMEAGNVEISWESMMTDGTVTLPPYQCISSNPDGVFAESSGRTSIASITTSFTTVYYTGEPGDTITCTSMAYPVCTDILTSETTTDTPVCTDLELDDPYVTNDSGSTVNIDLTNESDLETLYDDNIVCFDFSVTTEAGFTGTLQASGYTDSGRSTLTSGLINLSVDSGGSYEGNPAFVGISGSTTYTGTLCWENYDENYSLNLEVVSQSVCQDSVALPPLSDTPPPDDDDDDDDNGDDDDDDDDNDYTCDDVVDVNDEEYNDCDEYTMEVCVEDDDIEVISDGDEICYDEDDDGDFEDDECDDDVLEIEGTNTLECYDVLIEGNVCEGEITVEYPNSDGDKVCFDDSPEVSVIGELNKYIYTFNFLSEKAYNSDEDVFFSHDEDRAFYTLEYTPAGGEDSIEFTDSMWDSDGIEGELGNEDGASGGSVNLADTYSELTEYNYSSIRAFGFGEEHEEDSEGLATYVSGFSSGDFMTFVPYLKYDNGSDSYPIGECVYSTDDDGDKHLESEGVCYDPEYTPEDDGKVVIENAGTVDDATIRIRYIGIIDSGIADLCDTESDTCLTEVFENTGTVTSGSESESDSANLVVICSYLLTSNGGDIYLESDLSSGSDISCAYIDEDQNYSSYSNSDGLVILDTGDDDDDDDDDTTSGSTTYYDSSYSSDSISVCDDSNDDNLIGNISSYVCEIVSAVSDLWKKSTVVSTTESHLSQATRNVTTAQSRSTYGNWSELEELKNSNNDESGVLYFDGSQSDTITLRTITVPCGAWTLIVEGADLHLAGDIQYATSCTDGSSITQNMPSIAFVVADGDIYVEDSSYHLVGVYYTNQSFNGDHRSAVNGALSFDGSLYGDLQPLLDQADYVGPPTLDGGSIVVRYDSRILLNTPPALSEYVDVNTEKAVN